MTSQWQTVHWWCGLCALLVVPTRGDAIYHMVQPGRLRALYGFDGHMNSTADADAGSALADGMEATIVGGGRYTNVAVEGMAYYVPGGDAYIEVRPLARRRPLAQHALPPTRRRIRRLSTTQPLNHSTTPLNH